jgi:hypothetical protein
VRRTRFPPKLFELMHFYSVMSMPPSESIS